MKLDSVKIKNFRGYGKNVATSNGYFCFDGLAKADFVILNGLNGFGKTSFFDAIEWGLTGSIKRLERLQESSGQVDVRNSSYLLNTSCRHDDPISVILKFDNGFKIERSSTVHSLHDPAYCEGFDYDPDPNCDKCLLKINDEFQPFGERLFDGVDLNFIYNVNFLGQETLNEFLLQKPSDRVGQIGKLLNLDILDWILNKSAKNTYTTEINSLKNQIKEIEDAIKNIDDIFKENSNFSSIEDYKKQILNNIMRFSADGNERLKIPECAGKLSLDAPIAKFNEFIKECILAKSRLDSELKNKRQSLKDIELYSISLKLKAEYGRRDAANYLKEHSFSDLSSSLTKAKEILLGTEKNYNAVTLKLNEAQPEFDKIWELQEDEEISAKINSFKARTTDIFNFIKKYSRNVTNPKFIAEDYVDELIKRFSKCNDLLIKLERKMQEEKKSLDIEVKAYSSLSKLYTEALQSVKTYIESQDDVNQCPVCHSTKVGGIDLSKATLIFSIDSTIFSSNEVKESLNRRQSLNKKSNIFCDDLKNQLSAIFSNFTSSIKCLIEEDIIENIRSEQKKINASREIARANFRKANSAFDDLKVYYKTLFNEEFNEDKPKQFDAKILDYINANLEKLEKEFLECDYHAPTTQSIEDILSKSKNIKQLSKEILENEVNGLERNISNLTEFERFKFPSEYDVLFDEFEKNKKDLSDHKSKCNRLGRTSELRQNIRSITTQIKNRKIEIIKHNKLINYIFSNINIDPKYDDFKFNHNFEPTAADDVILPHIYSTSQRNALSLSIFLGMGLADKLTEFGQLFMDDPIQNMDDINIHNFIDILRFAIRTKVAKRIVLSTHDSNFADLLSIKLRNFENILRFDFVSYKNNGPIIEMRDIGIKRAL